MRTLFIICAVTLFSLNGFGQSSIKQTKQQTKFFYTQLNLHGGYIHDANGGRIDFTNRGPKNQLAFQYFSRNKKNLQKGYVKFVSLNSSKVRFSLVFDNAVTSSGLREANFKVNFLDTWLKFNTKWDRTKFWIGNKSIPYGHNPQLDLVSNFMTNLIKMDIGFVQDLGIFIKTPISNNFDLELAITSGGVLNKPVLVCDNLIDNDATQSFDPRFFFSNYKYENTWLVTSHIGNPTYRKNEFGINLVSGRINNVLVPNDLAYINRVGGDWVFKYYEKLKWTNQITVGHTQSQAEGSFGTVHMQTSLDLFTKNKLFLTTSFAGNYLNSFESSTLYHFNCTSANSLTYAFNPHTRIRLNHYYSAVREMNETRWGVLLQFVTGFGKRP